MAPVLPSFLGNSGERFRGGSGAQQWVLVRRERQHVEQNLQRFQVLSLDGRASLSKGILPLKVENNYYCTGVVATYHIYKSSLPKEKYFSTF